MDTPQILERVSIFSRLSQEELNSVAQLCERRKYKANDIIFAEKSKGEELYIVIKGQVRIELGIKGKTDYATVHRIRENEVFGEMVVVSEGRRSGTAQCETDCEVIAIGRDALLKLFEKHNRIGYVVAMNLASVLTTRLRKTDLQIVACLLWE